MNSDAAAPGSPPATDPAPAPAAQDGEAGRIRSLDDLARTQQEQGRTLDRILGMLTGGQSPQAPAAGDQDGGGGKSIAQQVQEGVEKIEARKQKDAQAADAKKQDAAWRAGVDERLERLAERRPAEPSTGFRARMQRALFGKPDER